MRASWISPELAHTQAPVLFVADAGSADVYIYRIPTLKLIGTVTGFSQPQGECSDNKGNVWVTDANAQTIYELSHHGRLENVLGDSNGYPVACAWDATTGNLAVMSLFGVSSTSGNVLVYPNGSGAPTSYQNPKQYYYNFGGYDGAGDLFFDGRDAKGTFILSELAKGASSAQSVKLTGGIIYFPGMVQWKPSKHQLIVGDQACGDAYLSCIYSVTVYSGTGKISAKADLQSYTGGSVCDLVQGVEYNGKLFGSDNDFCGSTPSATYAWPYPRGGAPTYYNNGTDSAPVGAAISR